MKIIALGFLATLLSLLTLACVLPLPILGFMAVFGNDLQARVPPALFLALFSILPGFASACLWSLFLDEKES